MFRAEIAAVIAAVFSIIPLFGLVGNIAGVVCGIIIIVGVYTAGKDGAGKVTAISLKYFRRHKLRYYCSHNYFRHSGAKFSDKEDIQNSPFS